MILTFIVFLLIDMAFSFYRKEKLNPFNVVNIIVTLIISMVVPLLYPDYYTATVLFLLLFSADCVSYVIFRMRD